MACPADKPTVFGPVEAAMEGVVELGAGCRPASLGEDRRTTAAGALAIEGRGRHRSDDDGPGEPREVPPRAKHQILGGERQEHQIRRMPVEGVEPVGQMLEVPGEVRQQRVIACR
jgi:hypothetical protein